MKQLIPFSLAILLFVSPVLARPVKKSTSKATGATVNLPKVTNSATKQEFIFLGCPGEEENFKEVTKVLISAQDAWNKHQLENLLVYYAPNFLSKDGMNLDKIKTNLTDFWTQYPDARIDSLPSTVTVCGNYATVSLTEITTATGQVEEQKVLPYPPKFRALIRGITTLKKSGDSWKIASEEILAEEMWKYYGQAAEKLIQEGKVKLVIPYPVNEGENYVAQLKYSLPDRVQAVALIDKVLLTEFPDDPKEKAAKEKRKEKEVESGRRNIEGEGDDGLRKLFTANSLGQDELIRAQIELVAFEEKGPSLLGVLGISQRVVPKHVPKNDKASNYSTITKTFKEESTQERTRS